MAGTLGCLAIGVVCVLGAIQERRDKIRCGVFALIGVVLLASAAYRLF